MADPGEPAVETIRDTLTHREAESAREVAERFVAYSSIAEAIRLSLVSLKTNLEMRAVADGSVIENLEEMITAAKAFGALADESGEQFIQRHLFWLGDER